MTADDQVASALRDLKDAVEKLRTELVRKDVYTAERQQDLAEVKTVRDDVAEVKGTMTWLSRTLVAALLLPLISSSVVIYVIQQGGAR